MEGCALNVQVWMAGVVMAASLATVGMAQSGQDAAPAQAAGTPDVPTFTLEVRRVPLDVVATDKQGHPLLGLKKSDFIVKEDKKQQKIMTFEWFNGATPDFVPPRLPPLPLNTYVDVPRTPERGPLYILYYDMVNTPQEDQMLFRKQLLKFVDNAPAGVRIAIYVNAMRLELVQGFTADHDLLKQAILSKGPGPHIPQVFIFARNLGRNDVGGVLSNLNFISQYLAGIPGRKNLIWLASRFPIPVGPTVYLAGGAVTAGGAPPSMSAGNGGGPTVLDLTDLTWQMVHRTYAAMMKSQIALYPVDLGGIGAGEDPADAMVNHQYMDTIAAETGGQAYYENNHLDELIAKAVEDGDSYYSLSYEPSEKDFDSTSKDAQERDIQVTLKNRDPKDYILRYREFYYAVPDDQVKADKTTTALQARFVAAKQRDTLYASIEHGAPMMHDLLFTAHLSADGKPRMATAEQMEQLMDSPLYFKTRKANKPVSVPRPVQLQKYVIEYGVIDPQLKTLAAHGGRPPVLEFAVAAYDNEGRLLNSILNQGVPSGKKGSNAKSDAFFSAVQEIEAPEGTAYIRMAVRDTLNDRTGTMEVKLPLKAAADEMAEK